MPKPITRVIEEPIIHNSFIELIKLMTDPSSYELNDRDEFYFRMIYYAAFAEAWKLKSSLENSVSAEAMEEINEAIRSELAIFSDYQKKSAEIMGCETVNTREMGQ